MAAASHRGRPSRRPGDAGGGAAGRSRPGNTPHPTTPSRRPRPWPAAHCHTAAFRQRCPRRASAVDALPSKPTAAADTRGGRAGAARATRACGRARYARGARRPPVAAAAGDIAPHALGPPRVRCSPVAPRPVAPAADALQEKNAAISRVCRSPISRVTTLPKETTHADLSQCGTRDIEARPAIPVRHNF